MNVCSGCGQYWLEECPDCDRALLDEVGSFNRVPEEEDDWWVNNVECKWCGEDVDWEDDCDKCGEPRWDSPRKDILENIPVGSFFIWRVEEL
jgi:primosomal protein N'